MTEDFAFKDRYVLADHREYFACMDEFVRPDGAQLCLLHIDVDPLMFSPGVMKRILHEWHVFRQCVDAPLFAIEDGENDRKHRRFLKLLGFQPLTYIKCNDGSSRCVFVSVKNKNEQENNRNEVHVPAVNDEPDRIPAGLPQ